MQHFCLQQCEIPAYLAGYVAYRLKYLKNDLFLNEYKSDIKIWFYFFEALKCGWTAL